MQIFLDGIIEAASLDQTCDTSALCGGSMTINGIVVTVPKNLIALFPANALTWQEIFNGGTTTVGTCFIDGFLNFIILRRCLQVSQEHTTHLSLHPLCGTPSLLSANSCAARERLPC